MGTNVSTPIHPHSRPKKYQLIKADTFGVSNTFDEVNRIKHLKVKAGPSNKGSHSSHLCAMMEYHLMRITFDCILDVYFSKHGNNITPIIKYIVVENTKHNITGTMTFFHDDVGNCCVSQIIEGEVDTIKQLFARINGDTRITQITGSHSTLIKDRDYMDWSVVINDPDAISEVYNESELRDDISDMADMDCANGSDTGAHGAHVTTDYIRLKILQQSNNKNVFIVNSVVDPKSKFILKEITCVEYSRTEYDILKRLSTPVQPAFIQELPDIYSCGLRTSLIFKMYEMDLFTLLNKLYSGGIGEYTRQVATVATTTIQFTHQMVQCYSAQLIRMIETMTRYNVIHCDVKDENIFIDRRGNLVLADFEYAFVSKKPNTVFNHVVGTPLYFAPEILEGKSYSHGSDLWAAAIVMCSLNSSELPWNGMDITTYTKSSFTKLYTEMMTEPPNLPEYAFSETHIDMMHKIFSTIDSRISIPDLKQHDYFDEYDWDNPAGDLGIMKPVALFLKENGLSAISADLNGSGSFVDTRILNTTYRTKCGNGKGLLYGGKHEYGEIKKNAAASDRRNPIQFKRINTEPDLRCGGGDIKW
jgi:serine/threonine protein kinase